MTAKTAKTTRVLAGSIIGSFIGGIIISAGGFFLRNHIKKTHLVGV